MSVDAPAEAQETHGVEALLEKNLFVMAARGSAALRTPRGRRLEDGTRPTDPGSRRVSKPATNLRRMDEAGVEHLAMGAGRQREPTPDARE